MKRTPLLLVVLLGFTVALPARQANQPLPERNAFLRDVIKKLRTDDSLQSQYTFIEREVQQRYDGNGKRTERTEKTYEVYPMPDGTEVYRRLIATGGVPTPARELEQADRKHREKVLEWARDRQRESAADRAKREKKAAEARQEEVRMTEDLLRIYDMQLTGREVVRGRPAIIVTFTPRPGVRPAMSRMELLTKIRGRALVDEREHEVVRVEMETLDTISIGFGLLARVYKGTTASAERQKVNDEVWLPMRMSAHARARVALLKKYDVEYSREYRDYKKFSVDTSTEFKLPK